MGSRRIVPIATALMMALTLGADNPGKGQGHDQSKGGEGKSQSGGQDKGGKEKGSKDKGSNAQKGTKEKTANQTRTKAQTAKTVEAKLASNPKLATKLQGLLPVGTDLQVAAAGFKNLGQFVAAVHVASNLGIPFDQLKTQMVTQGLSLGQAIQVLRPKVNAEAEADKGERQAKKDLTPTS